MNLFRVSLIGTGGGYGESVVVQLGMNNWMVVDSCIDPVTKESLPLEYLKSLGVHIETEVKLIVCSHWHNDHILGIDKLLEECKSATFAFAVASDKNKFLEFIGLDSRNDKLLSHTSSTDIMSKCLSIVNQRKIPVKTILQDRVLYSRSDEGVDIRVTALSPSDAVISDFGTEISELMRSYVPCSNRKIIVRSPNEKCVVLQVSVNEYTAILGGDLETSTDNKRGWLCILDNCNCISKNKASLYKIPHHGSENAYEKRVWDEMFDHDLLVGQLSPFINGKVCLPTKDMLDIFIKNVNHLYITSFDILNKPKKRDNSLQKAIRAFNPTLKEIPFRKGIIENYIDLDIEKCTWKTNLHGKAFEIDNEFISAMR